MSTILVVEDEPSQRRQFKMLFDRDGHEVLEAQDARQALGVLGAAVPDIALVDIGLPGAMDGFELCARIQKDARTRRMPVLFLTGRYMTKAEKLRGLKLGAVDYMFKPFLPNELAAKVYSLLSVTRAWSKSVDRAADTALMLRRGPVRVDLASRKVWVNETLREVQPRRYDLLTLLLRRPDGVHPEDLPAQGWPETSPNALAKIVQRLREDLGEEAAGFIVCLSGVYKAIG